MGTGNIFKAPAVSSSTSKKSSLFYVEFLAFIDMAFGRPWQHVLGTGHTPKNTVSSVQVLEMKIKTYKAQNPM